MNLAFNDSIQSDFLVVYIRLERNDVLNIVDTGTAYSEHTILSGHNAETMQEYFEATWICSHGAPTSFSADPEFFNAKFVRYLKGHNIDIAFRLARSSNKNGIVERNNGTFRAILVKITR